jgi:hypothetical protein
MEGVSKIYQMPKREKYGHGSSLPGTKNECAGEDQQHLSYRQTEINIGPVV